MIRILNELPKDDFAIAVSGGVDSVVCLDFLLGSRKNFKVAHFNHGTLGSDVAEAFVRNLCKKRDVECVVGQVQRNRHRRESSEEYWRDERYRFLESFDCPVITCHHLDDVIETWIFSSLHGQPKLIPYRRNNIIRPFLMTYKKDFYNWAANHTLRIVSDPSNGNVSHMRNLIRKEIVPKALIVNPGLGTLLRKKIEKKYREK